MGIIAKVEKFKIRYLHRISIVKVNSYTCEDVLRDCNKQNSRMNFLHPGGNDAEQEIE